MVDYNDYDEKMVDVVNARQKKLKTVDDVINQLKESIDVVGPVSSLVALVGSYRGDNIYEQIKDYLMCGGKPGDFYKIIDEQKYKYIVYKKNIKSMGAKSSSNEVKRKRVNKKKFKEWLLALILCFTLLLGATYYISSVMGREAEYQNAVDIVEDTFVVEQTGSYSEGLEALDVSVLGNVDAISFSEYLKEKGFGKYEIIYLTAEILGEESADIVCENYGDKNLDTFLEKYFFDSVTSFDTTTAFQKHPSYRKLSNWVEESIKRKVKINMEEILESYKTGIGRGL